MVPTQQQMYESSKTEKIPMLVYHGSEDDVLTYKIVKPNYDKYLKNLPNFKFQLVPNLYHSVILKQLT